MKKLTIIKFITKWIKIERNIGRVFDGHEVFTQEELDALSYVGESAGVGAVVGAGVYRSSIGSISSVCGVWCRVACFFSLFFDD